MKFRSIVAVAFGIGLMPNSSMAVKIDTLGKTETELNSDIVLLCQYQMGEYGSEGLDACVKAERAARTAMADYPDELEEIVGRCYRAVRMGGWHMVQRCSDKDVAARDALQSYAAKYADIVEVCRDEVGRSGHDRVKQCADEQIGKQEGTAR